jgi:hypothetical protein
MDAAKPHPDWQLVLDLWPNIREYQKLADKHNVGDIFQDNNGKLLQALLVTGLKNSPGRMGNDAVDEHGREYELKTVNLGGGRKNGFTTHHHLNVVILKKYRAVQAWVFSVYDGIELEEIYVMRPAALEAHFFAPWEANIAKRISEGKSPDLNNPKIPVWFVRKHGIKVYPTPTAPPVDLKTDD